MNVITVLVLVSGKSAGRRETYDERVGIHLVGAVLPLGTLRESRYYGKTNPAGLGEPKPTGEGASTASRAGP